MIAASRRAATQQRLAADGGKLLWHNPREGPPRLKPDVDMTSVVKCTALLTESLPHQLLSSFSSFEDTRVSAETGPVTSTVDPAEIRGLGTT